MQVDERCGPAELETNVSENNPFDNFSYKVLYISSEYPIIVLYSCRSSLASFVHN